MNLVSPEIAVADVTSWLDYKKISEQKREVQKAQIDVLVDGVSEGVLVLQEDKSWKQTLKFPLEGEGNLSLKELNYKPRLGVGEIQLHLQKFKSTDFDGRVLAHVLALTKTAQALISKVDTEDYSIAQAIAVFFVS